MTERFDVAIVGAGIVGLSQAREAVRRGLRVVVIERHSRARGASIRNFGMIWPIGQPAGVLHRVGLRSRDIWLDVCREAGLWHEHSGSLHLVTRTDELAVLREFAERAPAMGYEVDLWDTEAVTRRSPIARPDAVIGGLFSGAEMCVDSPRAMAGIAAWLSDTCGVEFRWSEPVIRIAPPAVHTARSVVEADRIIVCSGSDFEQLYPESFAGRGITRCKLQMLAAEPPPRGARIGPMIASGLSLRHYANFAQCPSLPALRDRIAREQPELDRFGVHVMASQHSGGEIILGDSHVYDDEMTPFDSGTIEELMLEELRRIVELPSWRITRRWNGTYAKWPGRAVLCLDPEPGVRIVNAAGGTGMTMSFGIAERMWENWNDFDL